MINYNKFFNYWKRKKLKKEQFLLFGDHPIWISLVSMLF